MGSSTEAYVREFTRHSRDVLLNLNELRKREILTDVTIFVGGKQFKAHKAVLIACSRFFYSVFSDHDQGTVNILRLPGGIQADGFQVLLEFIYTSRLLLCADLVDSVLAAANYLQMEHVIETCYRFIQTRSENFYLKPVGVNFPVGLLPAQSLPSWKPLPCDVDFTSACSNGLGPAGMYVQRSVVKVPPNRYYHRPLTPFQESAILPVKPLETELQEPRVLYTSQSLHTTDESRSVLRSSCYDAKPIHTNAVLHSLVKEQSELTGDSHEHKTPQSDEKTEEEASRKEDYALLNRALAVATPDSPMRSEGLPNSPTESSSCGNASLSRDLDPGHKIPTSPDPKACNWKKYKFIVLNSLNQSLKEGSDCTSDSGSSTPPRLSQNREIVGRDDDDLPHEMESPQSSPISHLEESLSPPPPPNCDRMLQPSCDICGQHFELTSELHHHMLLSHPGEDISGYPPEISDRRLENGLFCCTTCELRFSEEEALQHHFLQVHSDDKPYKCDMCHAAFRYKGNLASHKTVHTGEKPYRCTVCGAQFNRPANLKTHARIHSGEKPYKCETCGARFVQVAHLRAHVLIHTGEKPYPCETCGTCFRHLQTLKSHIRIHTGEKPYHCEKCDLHFRHKSQLRLHLRQKHGAITNTKIRYKVFADSCVTPVGSC